MRCVLSHLNQRFDGTPALCSPIFVKYESRFLALRPVEADLDRLTPLDGVEQFRDIGSGLR